MRRSSHSVVWLALAGLLLAVPAAAQLKIAYIDPLSGGAASAGILAEKHLTYLIDRANTAGGFNGEKLQLMPFDNKVNPQESLIALKKALDDGARYVFQGNGSAVALAITDAVLKHNERNPGKEALFFNYAAVDPALTNEKCNFWHFRFDADADMKMSALTDVMAKQPQIKKVYLINQDYSFGQAVRAAANSMLKAKRPDIQIVGDELVPLLKITDFSPYIAKIKASGADSVITGNWSQDFALLLKAAADAGLQVDWFTYYAGLTGGPVAVRQTNLNHRVFAIMAGEANIDNAASRATETAFRAKYDIAIQIPQIFSEMRMLAAAITKAGAPADAIKIAGALEGMDTQVFNGGKGMMRKDDHQFFQPMYIASFGERTASEPFDEEKTGWGWRAVIKIDGDKTILPTTCKMTRPN